MNTFKIRLVLPLLGFACLMGVVAPQAARAGVSVGVSITLAPPELPVYEQPPLPEPGYLWTPGYWAWGPDGYFWVPGTWVRPPRIGFLWTPGYWGWNSGFFIWNAGYWGPHVGFYGGVNYGYGYGGVGYEGGYWRGNNWYYNRAVNRFDDRVHVTNVYERNVTVINNVTVNRVSYNGGRGGIDRRPTRDELNAGRGPHVGYTRDQRAHERGAERDRSFLATENHGRPAVLATPRPGAFGPGMNGGRVERSDRPPSAGGRPAGRDEPAMRGNDANRAGPNRAQPGRTDRPAQRQTNERREFPQAAPQRGPEQSRAPQSRGPERSAPERNVPERRAPEQSAPVRSAPQQRGAEPRGPGAERGPARGPTERGPSERGPGAQERRGQGERGPAERGAPQRDAGQRDHR
jgi:hypothetical protein